MQEEHISPAAKWHLSRLMINRELHHLGTLKGKAACIASLSAERFSQRGRVLPHKGKKHKIKVWPKKNYIHLYIVQESLQNHIV